MCIRDRDKAGEVLDSGYIGQGPKVDEFEKQIGDYFGNNKVVTTNAGTSALHLALHLLKKPKPHWNEDVFQGVAFVSHNWPGIEDGDEVLATPLTCTASNWPIVANGLKIKWVDIDPTTLNMCLKDLEKKMTTKTKAIMGSPNNSSFTIAVYPEITPFFSRFFILLRHGEGDKPTLSAI